MNEKVLEKANEKIKKCDDVSFGVIDENGYPSVSTVTLVKPENISELFFSTSLHNCNKVNRLRANNKASVCCRIGRDDNITLVGTAEILVDQETKSKFWESWFIEHYTGGETDPDYCIIQFTTKRVSLWIDKEGAEFVVN